jgi:hypothetical protein
MCCGAGREKDFGSCRTGIRLPYEGLHRRRRRIGEQERDGTPVDDGKVEDAHAVFVERRDLPAQSTQHPAGRLWLGQEHHIDQAIQHLVVRRHGQAFHEVAVEPVPPEQGRTHLDDVSTQVGAQPLNRAGCSAVVEHAGRECRPP